MNNLKIGDKIRLKKLSNKEFKETYRKKYNNLYLSYNAYLSFYNRFSNQIFEIRDINTSILYCKNCIFCFYEEEIEKVNYLKTKYKIVKELLKNE